VQDTKKEIVIEMFNHLKSEEGERGRKYSRKLGEREKQPWDK
jgi:hypothetical protein